ncbi:hypothetical protein SVIOM74S_03865 [Streptomyces violarus]
MSASVSVGARPPRYPGTYRISPRFRASPHEPSPVPAAATAVVTPVRRPAAAAFRLLVALAAAVGVTLELLLGDPSLNPGLLRAA